MHLANMLAQTSWINIDIFLDQLDPHVLLIHEDLIDVGHKVTLRFQNGFGVEIIQPFSFDNTQPVFKVTVLRFLGARMDDSIRVKYNPSTDGNWVDNLGEIISLSRQVASLKPWVFDRDRGGEWRPGGD